MQPNYDFRHEYKHTINLADSMALRQRLSAVATPDPHAGAGSSYLIRSLYFDNQDDKALREKIEGLNHREKFRIRYYNGDDSFIRIEKKMKIDGLCAKVSAPVSRAECELLLAGSTEWMLERKDPLLYELYYKMQYQQIAPKTVVDYQREAYVFKAGNVRVTLDSQIRSGLCSCDFFNPELPTVSVSNAIVLEVKYDRFLPQIIADIVQTPNRQSSAFSKYAVCRTI